LFKIFGGTDISSNPSQLRLGLGGEITKTYSFSISPQGFMH
jgi:hypothetical protein